MNKRDFLLAQKTHEARLMKQHQKPRTATDGTLLPDMSLSSPKLRPSTTVALSPMQTGHVSRFDHVCDYNDCLVCLF